MRKAIGILGGMGPQAGADLFSKIISHTSVKRDQDHHSVLLYSLPNEISGRPEYLLNKKLVNPGYAMGNIMVEMAKNGAQVIGIPCNTAHSSDILDIALDILKKKASFVTFVHIIEAEGKYLKEYFPHAKKVGILCTVAAYNFRIFQNAPALADYELVFPDEKGRDSIQSAISNDEYGIKVYSNPVTAQSIRNIEEQLDIFIENQVDVVLLACSELPLAFKGNHYKGLSLIDTTDVLAQALITEITQ